MTGGPFAQTTGLDNCRWTTSVALRISAPTPPTTVPTSTSMAPTMSPPTRRPRPRRSPPFPTRSLPAGQAAIIAIIEKYHGKSAGTVEGAAATEQATGAQAADGASDSKDDDDDHDDSEDRGGGMGGGTSLMDILGSLLGAGELGSVQDEPDGPQGMSPMGSQGMSPFGDPYGPGRGLHTSG